MRGSHINITKSRLTFIALAALLSVYAPAVLAQCSTGAWSGTTGTVAAIGSSTEVGARQYENLCGLTIEAASPGFVTTDTPNEEILVITRFYVYAEELDLASGDAVIYRGLGDGETQFTVAVRDTVDGKVLVTSYRAGDTLVEHPTTAPLRPTWQAITLGWSADPLGGSLYLKLDGLEQFNLTGLDNNGEFVDFLDFGLIGSFTGSGKLVVDAVEIRRAAPEPPLLSVQELANISTRAAVGNGAYAVVGGFIVEGDTQKCVVIRGRGQSIQIGIAKLQDPTLTLKEAGNPTVVEFNDNWRTHPQADLIEALNLQPGDDSEAAIYRCLEPGGYTAELRSVAGQPLGLGIVEIFDADQGTPYLLNISTRAEVITGARRVNAGFIISGEESREVLIRGRGPTVQISRPLLADPTIELRQGSTVVASNDNWKSDNESAITATGLAPTNDLESALLITLDPGSYTVFLASAADEPGLGIIEVFDMTGGSISTN